ncbi:hypothetical protein CDAR_532371 [Caerostris darwini]|uniref:Uncharacterized protein n=1 Tax=Caerostris darwini TaxID=1538125 RepID=A0AAV4Q9Y8_9ARAC|nr:hypothetical protein CDAR_532371 [Caerostris darwini]
MRYASDSTQESLGVDRTPRLLILRYRDLSRGYHYPGLDSALLGERETRKKSDFQCGQIRFLLCSVLLLVVCKNKQMHLSNDFT